MHCNWTALYMYCDCTALYMYCRDDTTKMSGHFDGYVEVHRKDELAVMEALMKHGPLAVGVDASFDEFLFYRWVTQWQGYVLGTGQHTLVQGTAVYWIWLCPGQGA